MFQPSALPLPLQVQRKSNFPSVMGNSSTDKRQKSAISPQAGPNTLTPGYPSSSGPSTFGAAAPLISMSTAAAVTSPRKRRGSQSAMEQASGSAAAQAGPSTSGPPTSAGGDGPAKKKARTNTPWTPAEEQKLKSMRDTGLGWGEIAKSFPNRTEGSVKKHWYKDMHYAEFAEDESQALKDAIREYETNKWKVIGQKLGKPAKACEQYAKEHFKSV